MKRITTVMMLLCCCTAISFAGGKSRQGKALIKVCLPQKASKTVITDTAKYAVATDHIINPGKHIINPSIIGVEKQVQNVTTGIQPGYINPGIFDTKIYDKSLIYSGGSSLVSTTGIPATSTSIKTMTSKAIPTSIISITNPFMIKAKSYISRVRGFQQADEIFAEYANNSQKLQQELTNNVIWTQKNKLRPEQLEKVRKDLIGQMKAIEENLPKQAQEYLSFAAVKNNPEQYPAQYNPKHYHDDYTNFLNATWDNIQNEWMRGVETMAGLIGLADKESLQTAIDFAKSLPQKGNDPTNILYRFRDATGLLATRLINIQPIAVEGKDKLTKELKAAWNELDQAGLADYTSYETDWHVYGRNNPEIERVAESIYNSNVYIVSSNAAADPHNNAYIILRQRLVTNRVKVEVEHFGAVRKGDNFILENPKPLIEPKQD